MSGARPKLAVLVVEDEVLVRMDLADMILNAGHDVFEAGSADEAIAVMERHPEIAVILTDVDMPGSMDGLRLAAYARDRWPPVGIIVASGALRAGAARLPEGALFFAKPYCATGILAALQGLTARAA